MVKTGFTSKECEYIKTFFNESLAINGSTPKYFTYEENTVQITKNVSGLCHDLKDKTLIDFILKRLKHLGIKSIKSSSISIIKYSKGDYFGKHRDISRGVHGAVYKTLVVQLSDESEYAGGEFCIEDKAQSKTQGCCILFLSSKEHEVKKVINGTRYSLTIFLHYDDFNIENSLF